MGYYSTITGELEIEPPLRWTEYRNSVYLAPTADKLLKLVEYTEEMETDEGTVQIRKAVGVEPTTDDSVKAYDLLSQLKQIVDAFPGHAFTGALRIEGEENSDLWKLTVVDGKVTEVYPTITWPDGTVEPRRR